MRKTTAIKSVVGSALILVMLTCMVQAESFTLQDMGTSLNFESLPKVTIYTAKKIITMDPNNSEANAVAVVGDRILAAGSLKKLEQAVEGQPYTVDKTFANKIIVPGFIAQHVHPFLAAATLTSEIISIEDWVINSETFKAVHDRDAYIKQLKAVDAKLKNPDELLLTWGFHHYFHDKLTRTDLDKINNRRPIIVWHRSCHEFILNSAALKQIGLTKEYMSKQSKSAQDQSNLEEGHFWEQGAMACLPLIAPLLVSPERMEKGLQITEDYLHANGITAASEPGGFLSKPLQDMVNAV
ncbi:MAG: amidohydrolase, partial [bacterium]|nr:amidohydrolase [bacterium]